MKTDNSNPNVGNSPEPSTGRDLVHESVRGFISGAIAKKKETLNYMRCVGRKEDARYCEGYIKALRDCLEASESDDESLCSARYILEDVIPEKLAELTGLPMGVIVAGLKNIFPANAKLSNPHPERTPQ